MTVMLFMPEVLDLTKYRDSRHVILYSHGNATDLGGCHEICELMSGILDAHVIVYDYPNYGASNKTTLEESLHRAHQAEDSGNIGVGDMHRGLQNV
jgi:hypothetical protein